MHYWLLKNRPYPIGVDMGDDALKVAQLAPVSAGLSSRKRENGKRISLIAGGSENLPADVEPGSANWQRWAIKAIRELTANGQFHGRDVIAAIPASNVFIDHIKMPKIKDGFGSDDERTDAIFSMIEQKLPFEPVRKNVMVKYLPAEEDNVLVIAAERKIIDRHLAIYEKAQRTIKSIGVWPIVLTNSYTSFFGRRKADIEAVVMLICIETNCTNVVICRAKTLLFARSIPIGAKQLDSNSDPKSDEGCLETQNIVTRLVLELNACRRHFNSMYRKAQMERLVFISGRAVDRDICTTIAKQLEMPAQIGDCLAAVEMANPCVPGIDRRISASAQTAPQMPEQINWAIAFGLSLS